MCCSHQAGAASANAFINSDVIRQLWKGEISVDNKTMAALGWMRIPDGDPYRGVNECSFVFFSQVVQLFQISALLFRETHPNVFSSLGGMWYHTGGGVGASSVLLIRPCSTTSAHRGPPVGVCVVMLCNLQDTSLLSLAKEVEEIFRP